MNILSVVAFCVVSALIGFVVKQFKPEFSTVVSILVVCAVVGVLFSSIKTVFEFIEKIVAISSVSNEYIKILIKSAGICYISHLGSSICKELEQNAISKQVELIGKISIILVAIPAFTELLKIVVDLSA